MSRRPPLLLVVSLVAASMAGAALAASADWRQDATRADQRRFARLDEAWAVAMAARSPR